MKFKIFGFFGVIRLALLHCQDLEHNLKNFKSEMASKDDNSIMNTERLSQRRASAESSLTGRGSNVSSQRTNHRTVSSLITLVFYHKNPLFAGIPKQIKDTKKP